MLPGGSFLRCHVKTVEYGYLYGLDSWGGRILYFIGRKLSDQPKVDAYHGFEYWVIGTHCHEDSPHRADIFLHDSFPNGESICCKYSGQYTLLEGLKERDLVSDSRQVVWDTQPCAVCLTLPPCCAVLLRVGAYRPVATSWCASL